MKKLIEKLKNILSDNFFKNTGWLIFDKVFHMALSIFITGYVARYLPEAQYGMLSYGLAFTTFFTALCKLGIDAIIVNEIIKNRGKTGEILGTTIVLRLVSALLSIICTTLFVLLLRPNQAIVFVITTVQSLSLVFMALDTFDFYFQSKLISKYSALARMISYPLVCLLRIVLVLTKADVTFFAAAVVLDSLTIGIVSYIFYKKSEPQRLHFSINMSKHLLKQSYHFIPSALMIALYTQMGKIMLGSLAANSDMENGFYEPAVLIANMWTFIPLALIDSGRPIIMTLKNQKEETKYNSRYTQLYSTVIWLSIVAGIGFLIFSPLAINIVFGAKYAPSANILRVLIWARLFSIVGTTRGIWMVCEDKGKYVKYFVGIGAVLNFTLNFIFIPYFGALGAAIAILLTEIGASVIAPLFFKKTRPIGKIMLDSFLLKGIRKKR